MLGGRLIILMVVMVVLVPGQSNSPPKKIILEDTVMMGGFVHLSVITYNPPRCYLEVVIIPLVLLMVICLVFLMVMIKLVWVLGPPTLPPKNFIVALIVVIYCRQVVGEIHPRVIHTNKGPIIYQILVWRSRMVLLVMVEVVLVLGPPTYPPKILFFRYRHYGGFQTLQHECTSSPKLLFRIRIILLVIMMVLSFVLVMVMEKVLWVLEPPTLLPNILIAVLMVVVL